MGRFTKGESGNPTGRPQGTRNRRTLIVEELLEADAREIVAKAIEMAKDGDPAALRMCMDRIAPVRKDRPIRFEMPAIVTTGDLTKATAALLAAVAIGDLTPSEAAELGKLVDAHVRAIEVTDIAERLARIEGQS